MALAEEAEVEDVGAEVDVAEVEVVAIEISAHPAEVEEVGVMAVEAANLPMAEGATLEVVAVLAVKDGGKSPTQFNPTMPLLFMTAMTFSQKTQQNPYRYLSHACFL